MAKYLHKFETNSEFSAAYNGEDYLEPWVSVTSENEKVKYNKTEYEKYEKLLLTPLTFEIQSDGVVYWKASDNSYTSIIEYSLNDGEWTSITSTTAGTEILVSSGDTVQFRGDNAWYSSGSARSNTFSGTTCQFKVYGNIMSLIDSTGYASATTLSSAYTFYNMFCSCTGLTNAENLILPATTLTEQCYYSMFSYCSRLSAAPKLPAMALAKGCYWAMFWGCTNLTTVLELPATSLAEACYCNMFYNCTSLTTAPELPAKTMVTSGYTSMFNGCTNLTTAPDLPATTLAGACYYRMFSGCTSLNYVKCLATDISATNCTFYWLPNVSSSGTFVKNPSMSSWPTGYTGIPNGWTVQDAS